VLDELQEALNSANCRADYITFSGSGEPTLNSQIGDMIHRIKSFTRVPVAVLTNGSLLYRADVRRELSEADLVVPSLDAVTANTFRKVNRPHDSLTMDLIIQGLMEFTQEFEGRIWLEIMIVKDINDDPKELQRTADLVRPLSMDRIHLNTVARPPAEKFAMAINAQDMRRIAGMFDDRAEVIFDFDKSVKHEVQGQNVESAVLSLLRRRPCTVGDISDSLGIHRNEVIKYVDHLTRNGSIRRTKHGDRWYYERASSTQIGKNVLTQT
jgi:wyosine [tRNA(Phe)-imidazoG37] synthetase (radical SAM superfamily)